MSVQMVRFRTTENQAAAVAEQLDEVFAAVHAAAPRGMRYTALRDAEEPVFTLILELPEGAENPLPSIPAAAAFRGWLPGRTDDDPAPRPCTVVGSYGA
ncbi:hypothetical protein B1813_19815 [Saccharomonospora piscinae]|uniref:Antibiotic biosynthesis monooxygenase n=1 Tax=Saccharomonospora piscinae TaxID=687388 RepID=A0A1V8ZZ39_SACPI|nr:hypothetical protein [Saccharomonospora piscinae]OQO90068.1 hypothetical protein B1813_19815 [Saccharomonospora piscinae]TLW90898.1 hypothetical protein FFT09_16565 [Saccharomonospora piscinae]